MGDKQAISSLVTGGEASAGPPLGPALGPMGVNIMEVINAIQGIRHVKGQLRGELQFSEIENYLIKKSTVSELAVDGIVEVIGGPFKGMKATITRVDHDKEEATVILLDAPYQLPVTVDANYLKPSTP